MEAEKERFDEENWKMAMRLEKDQLEDEIESEEWEKELQGRKRKVSKFNCTFSL